MIGACVQGVLLVSGCAGSDGTDGRDGVDGTPAIARVVENTDTQCPAGGTVLEVGTDGALDLVVVCNGVDGEAGAGGPAGEDGEPGEKGARGEQGTQGLVGPQGPAGDPGNTGPVGPAGAAGPAGPAAISGSIDCGSLVDGSIGFRYEALVFSDDSVWASAAVYDAASQASGVAVYAPDEGGRSTAPVTVVYDVEGSANRGTWVIVVDRSALRATLTYTDADLPNGQSSYQIDDCAATEH